MDVFEKGLFYTENDADNQYSNFLPALIGVGTYKLFANKAEKRRYDEALADRRKEFPSSGDETILNTIIIPSLQQFITDWEAKQGKGNAGDKRVANRTVASGYERLDELKSEYKKLVDKNAAEQAALSKINPAQLEELASKGGTGIKTDATLVSDNTKKTETTGTGTGTGSLTTAGVETAIGDVAQQAGLPPTVGGAKTSKVLLWGGIAVGALIVYKLIKRN